MNPKKTNKISTSDGYMPKKTLILTKKPATPKVAPQYYDPEDKKYYKTPIV